MRKPLPPLSPEERFRILAALHYLHSRVGTWLSLARGLRAKRKTLRRVRAGGYIRRHRNLAQRLASMAGVTVGDLLSGKYPPPGACPHCGRKPSCT